MKKKEARMEEKSPEDGTKIVGNVGGEGAGKWRDGGDKLRPGMRDKLGGVIGESRD